MERMYIAIDLKSFYASVECVDRGLDPLTTNLVVADLSRTEKTICLAVSPALKSLGIPGRARLFEVVQRVREVNAERRTKAPGRKLTGESVFAPELRSDPSLKVNYIVAPPRMKKYMEISADIYKIYMNYVAQEDIHVYSVDEVFMDVTAYLRVSGMTAHEFAMHVIRDVLSKTGITATAGIGPNLYLAKIAMDVEAKHIPEDEQGVRIAELTERSYREKYWSHRPITDFWRVGAGSAKRLASRGLYTMGDVAACSIRNEDLLYDLFGVNAELLIDHAWGWEPVTIADIKAYHPESSSSSLGQVLKTPYPFDKAKLVVKEMTDALVLELVEKKLVTDQMVLTVGYDVENVKNPQNQGKNVTVTEDRYGRKVPKSAHGSINLENFTSSTRLITDAVMELFDRIVDPELTVRRMYVVANHTKPVGTVKEKFEQFSLFEDPDKLEREREEKEAFLTKEKKLQEAVLSIKKKYGKNAVLRGMNLSEGATAMERNAQIGGHRAGETEESE
ncbi:MAG: DNA methylase [Lachnospiraceae bacterium]|nr:DNA methylase [Lachnospiraceae bacterium]